MKKINLPKIRNRIKNNLKNNKGFVLLFAVTLAAIILSIALGISNISLKELNFSTQAKDTNDAFFAADTAIECALYYDKSTISRFTFPDPGTGLSCASALPISAGNITNYSYSFNVTGLGSTAQGCAIVTIAKDNTASPIKTALVAKGYNVGDSSCVSTNPNRVEREIDLNY